MTHKPDLSWKRLLDALRTAYPELYRDWFDQLPPATLEGTELRVLVDNPSQARYLHDYCSNAFAEAAMSISGHLIAVRFYLPADAEDAPTASSGGSGLTAIPLSPDYTFTQFVVGPSNRLAHAACRAVCGQPGTLYNPLFIHGAAGMGKTHLVQAVAAELKANAPDLEVLYVSCETFVNDLVRAIECGELLQFRNRARRVNVLCVDDVQFLANRESSQEELFHTFNILYTARSQIILTADSPPHEIPALEDRLVSRFNWGLVAQIDPPTRETRQAILQRKARLRGVKIPAEVLDYMAERVQSNIRLLEGMLTKLVCEIQFGGKSASLETAREVLEGYGEQPTQPVQVSNIIEAVTGHFGVGMSELLSRRRSRSIAYPRQIAMYLSRRLTALSLEEIGGHFGGRDGSTVLHAQRVIEMRRRKDREVADALSRLTARLLARN